MFRDVCGSASHPLQQVVACLVMLSAGAFFTLYVVSPLGYRVGPALLLITSLTVLLFRPGALWTRPDNASGWLLASLLFYTLCLAAVLFIHQADSSEFDLPLRYLAAGLVLLLLLQFPVSPRLLYGSAALGGVVAAGVALYQVSAVGMDRAQGFDNPIHFGNGALALAAISAAALGWARFERHRAIWMTWLLAGMVGGLVASLMSWTRSGWVALPFMLILGLLAWRGRWSGCGRNGGTALAVVTAAVLLGALFQVDTVRYRFDQAAQELVGYFERGQNDTSIGLRLDMYRAGLTAFSREPLSGAGPDGLGQVIDELVVAGEIHPDVAGYRHLHNQYIDNLARYGLPGLVSYLLLLGVPLTLFFLKARSGDARVSAAGSAGVLFVSLHVVVNLTQSMLERNIGVIMFVFGVVFIWSALKYEEARGSEASVSQPGSKADTGSGLQDGQRGVF
nr:O-antigen ligase family protein [Marinobacter bryozoorum]